MKNFSSAVSSHGRPLMLFGAETKNLFNLKSSRLATKRFHKSNKQAQFSSIF